MGAIVALDPITRIEGHLKASVDISDQVVRDAWLTGGMFRGFEGILQGRDPRDAPQIVQRVCGVCPVSHALASCMALENAAGAVLPPAAVLLRNLMQGANFLQSHLLSFYQLSSQDFFRGPDTSPFAPRQARPDLRLGEAATAMMLDQYLESLDMRALCHEMAAIFGGRMPHVQGIVPGGTTEPATVESVREFRSRLDTVIRFVEKRYVPLLYMLAEVYADLGHVGRGCGSAMCMGVFPYAGGDSHALHAGIWHDGRDQAFDPGLVREEVRYSWFTPDSGGSPFDAPPLDVDLDKAGAYSFSKSARYAGLPMEVGPQARLWISDLTLSPMGRELAWTHLGKRAEHFRDLGEEFVFSIMGRHLARAEETWFIADAMRGWLKELEPGAPSFISISLPEEGAGHSFTEAPRGALMHYVRIHEGRLSAYQILPATLWNCSPRDDRGVRGPMEEALVGLPVPDEASPVNVGRLIRAFDP